LSREIIIKVSKCTLVLTETELMNALASRPEIFQNAIRRGKGLLRAQNVERRQYQVDRWQLYEWLKGNRIPEDVSSQIESMGVSELKEGAIEFLLTKQREAQIK
jgi:hypothetical protein